MSDGTQDAPALKYRAFLSDRTADRAVAEWLHRRLETYRVPRDLVGRRTERGVVPPRLRPVYRDRDDARTAEDIETVISQELSHSEQLVVLCTPRVNDERSWVNPEIELCRARRPGAPIHAVLVEGEPPGCFPRALRTTLDGKEHMPLAGDLRPRARGGLDGQERAFIRLVAGLLGVSFDDLWRRERRRRLRTAAVLSVALAVTIGVSASFYGRLTDIGDSRRLAANAMNLVNREHDLALLLAAEAYDTWLTEEAEDTLLRVAGARPRLDRHVASAAPQAVLDPTGRRIYTGDSKGGLAVFDLQSGQWTQTVGPAHGDAVRALRMSADGTRLATLWEDVRVRTWEVPG